jgi:hypothetical protein
MRFGVGHRLAGGFAAMWLAISLALPSAFRVCPTHSVVPTASAATQLGHTDHGLAASHDAHPSGDAPCDCLTSCCVPTPLVSSRPVAVAAVEADVAAGEIRPAGALQSPLRRDHSSPFQTAPPNAAA